MCLDFILGKAFVCLLYRPVTTLHIQLCTCFFSFNIILLSILDEAACYFLLFPLRSGMYNYLFNHPPTIKIHVVYKIKYYNDLISFQFCHHNPYVAEGTDTMTLSYLLGRHTHRRSSAPREVNQWDLEFLFSSYALASF